MGPKKFSLEGIVYWGTFLFAAISMSYLLVTLINLSVQEDTAYLGTTNYRQQVRTVEVVTTAGNLRVLLMRAQSQTTIKNFLKLAQSGFYGGATFKTFDQGIFADVGTRADSTPESFRHFTDENSRLPITRGLVVLLKNKGHNVDAAKMVFFVKDDFTPTLGVEYVTLGSVTDGMDIVDKINSLSPGADEDTKPTVAILDITID